MLLGFASIWLDFDWIWLDFGRISAKFLFDLASLGLRGLLGPPPQCHNKLLLKSYAQASLGFEEEFPRLYLASTSVLVGV